jgi:TPR repeat protein
MPRVRITATMVRILFSTIVFACVSLAALGSSAADRKIAFRTQFDGMEIIGLEPPEGAIYDFPIVDAAKGVAKLIEAMTLINKKSPYSVSRIADLKREGPIIIIYDPHMPDRNQNMANILAAIFMPAYGNQLTSDPEGKSFPVVVSRYGIKWPLKELAPVLVHELVGHGVQHLEERLYTMRQIDVECEAWLYTEMAHQELGMENFTNERVLMRKNLALQCEDFFRHLENNDPEGYAVWHVLTPNIPKLLTHFELYLDELRRTGAMGEFLANAATQVDEARAKLFQNGTPEEQFIMAEQFGQGIGVEMDLGESLRWYTRAAERGHAEAQRIVGDALARPGPDRDLVQAAGWYEKSALQGNAQAQYTYGMFFVKGTGGNPKDPAQSVKWYAKAAIQGHAKAQYRLGRAYEAGEGVDGNLATAARWYALAAEQVASARFRLGVLHETGRGVEQDFVEAARLYRLAIDQGSDTASAHLVKLEQAHPEVMQ